MYTHLVTGLLKWFVCVRHVVPVDVSVAAVNIMCQYVNRFITLYVPVPSKHAHAEVIFKCRFSQVGEEEVGSGVDRGAQERNAEPE